MPRPTVLIATTDPVMAYALKSRLRKPCNDLGLRLEICPGGEKHKDLKVRAYDCAEALFDHLASVANEHPMDLADTLVILDVGAQLQDAFEPAARNTEDGWHRTNNRAGVAAELILRFPQAFPVILSPAVPVSSAENTCEQEKVLIPKPLPRDENPDGWLGFRRLRSDLETAKQPGEKVAISSADSLLALRVPLHFVTPLDGGCGLVSILTRFARGMRCWFDPTGLRTLVKNRFLGTLFGSDDNWTNTWFLNLQKKTGDGPRRILLNRLQSVAVAIDEEREFAMFNAYAAYKFGRRGWMVITFHEFDTKPIWVVSQNSVEDVAILRDIDLRFPDVPTSRRDLREELKSVETDIWQKVDDKDRLGDKWRVRAVSSHPKVVDGMDFRWRKEAKQVRLGERFGEYYGRPKPIESLYELAQLLDDECPDGPSILSQLYAVTSKGILPSSTETSTTPYGHGAPYLNLAMAESLLHQAKRCQDGPMENLLGALLAHEAYELLLGMSKTTALEALLLVHKKEVAAEVEFPGVSHDINIDERRRDVDETLHALYGTDEPERTATSKRMFRSQFWAELRLVYKNGEQFKAAEAANTESLIHSRWLPSSDGNATCDWVIPPKRILVRVATTFKAWALAAVTMIFVFSALYAWFDWLHFDPSYKCAGDYLCLFGETVLTSFGLQLTTPLERVVGQDRYFVIAAIAHIGLSYVLFGLLISMLYRKVTRA